MYKFILFQDIEDSEYDFLFIVKSEQFEKAKKIVKKAKKMDEKGERYHSLFAEVEEQFLANKIEYIYIDKCIRDTADLLIEY